MDSSEAQQEIQSTQPTQQATQSVLDPRRLGKQNSGFSDNDIADIVCILLPYSEGARTELREMALRTSQHMVDADEAAHPDLQAPEGMSHMPHLVGEHAIVLRLSAQLKNPLLGFTFGRNQSKCDIYFANDPHRRLSNIHFRIYLNEYGVLMLEDSSMNGTVVDGHMLKSKEGKGARPGDKKLPKQRTLIPGSQVKILMAEREDDLNFILQIPRREGEHEEAFRKNRVRYMKKLQALRAEAGAVDVGKTITPGPGGHVDLFPGHEARRSTPRKRRLELPEDPTQEDLGRLPREWNGSGKYNRVGRIGKGAFATVYKVTAKFDGRPYAAKELDKRKFMKDGVLDQKVENEMKIMQKAKHPNIVEYFEHLDWENRLMVIIMEYVPNGDLGNLISEHQPLRENIVQEMTSQLMSALSYLHGNNITHRDVKPDNILVQNYQPFTVKLTDFGLSKMVDTEQTFLKTFCGTLLYCAPEVYNEFGDYDEYGQRHPRNRARRRPTGQRYDHAIDIWSLGGVLYYTLTGQPPYPAKNGISYNELLHQIMTKKLNTQPLSRMGIQEDGIDFLLRMLQRRPEQRATIEELRNHPWLQGTQFSQERPRTAGSHEEIDDELGKEASQLSLDDKNGENGVVGGDEIGTDEDLDVEQFVDDNMGDTGDCPTDFDRYESQKENYTFGQTPQQPQRLFGEVSAVSSSVAIPSARLNLPVSASLDGTQIFDPEVKDSYGSEDSTPRQPRKSQATPRAVVPTALDQSRLSAGQSITDFNNMTFDVESQDLEGAESQLENLNMKSLVPSHAPSNLSSFNTSKRKPSHDTSDEFGSTPRARPPVKRLRSENIFDAISHDEEMQQNLYSQVPPLARINSTRQIDKPVHKSTYWDARDRQSWHLHYPEMTQLQHDAFTSAAKARGETFAPGKSPLWDIAMKHFAPASSSSVFGQTESPGGSSTSEFAAKASDRRHSEPRAGSAPPGPAGGDEDMPDTLPSDYSAFALAQADTPLNRVVATLESAPGSVVSGISIVINQTMVSWGRATDNTHIYTPRTEAKVPKYALKVMMWKDGWDPSKNFRPWNSPGDDLHFYISTKSTHGIQVNRTILPSHEPRNPRGSSQNWIRLHDGDTVVFWRSGDDEMQAKAKLTFRCVWGGSAKQRGGTSPTAELEPAETGDRLDAACRRAEERIGKLAEYDQRLQDADLDASERQRNIERERLRSLDFETKRLEACRVLAMRASRRGSPACPSPAFAVGVGPPPASAPPNMLNGFASGAGVIARPKSVPALRHASSTVDVRGTLHTMAEE